MTQPESTRRFAVSVIISLYNQSLTLRWALMSLLAQKDAPPFEIIICDDGSNRDVFDACRPLLDAAEIPVLWVWQPDHANRVAASRNNGIRLARGDILIFLDGDMVPEEDFVAGHVAAHTGEPTIIVGRRKWRSLELASAAPAMDGPAAILELLRGAGAIDERSAYLEDDEKRIHKWRFKHDQGWCIAATCNLSVDRTPEVWFDEGFTGYGGEDSELAYRLVRLSGFGIRQNKHLQAYHMQLTAFDPMHTGSHASIVNSLRNLVYFADKWPEAQQEYGYFPIRRIRLQPETNTWTLRQPYAEREAAPYLLDEARAWLKANA